MKILVLSAYHAPSHRRWVEGLVERLSHHDFQVLTQPPRHFPWRSRGNSLTWAFDGDIQQADPDVIIATSMVDLAGLRGMVPHLAQIPTLVYFHENQFAYPTRDERINSNLLVTNLYTALAADRVLFNSGYNRSSFLKKADSFLDLMPDQVPDGVIDEVRHQSAVLPVPLEDELFSAVDNDSSASGDEPLRIVWNHRWEYDKAPQRFFKALFSLQSDFEFRLVVLGQQFREAPPIFDEARRRLDDRIDHWGWVEDRGQYLRWLADSDIVVSTAIHDFQGLAVQEAAVCGCLPVLPERVAYPNFFDDAHLYPSHRDDPEADAASLADHLAELLVDPQQTRALEGPDLSHLRWSTMVDRYDGELCELTAHTGA